MTKKANQKKSRGNVEISKTGLKQSPSSKIVGATKPPPAKRKRAAQAKISWLWPLYNSVGTKAPSKSLLASAPKLWEDLELLAFKLSGLAFSAPETVELLRLRTLSVCFLSIAKECVKTGGARTATAIGTLLNTARFCVEYLEEAARKQASRAPLEAIARKESAWPVLLSPKEKSIQEARKYVHDLGVGSHRPFANMKDSSENQWRKLALMLIQQICSSRVVLQMQAKAEPPGDENGPWEPQSIHMILYKMQIPTANRWKQVLNLPPQFNSETSGQWWSVAKEMLSDYWESVPVERDALFNSVKKQAANDSPPKKPGSYATRQVQKIFMAIARKGGPSSPAW